MLRISGIWSGDYTVSGGSTVNFNSYLLVTGNLTGATTSAAKPVYGIGSATKVMQTQIGLLSKRQKSRRPSGSFVYGFRSDINASTAADAYNFYAAGDAPNYFAGGITSDGGLSAQGIRSVGGNHNANWGGNQYAAFYANPTSVNTVGSQGFIAHNMPPGSDGKSTGYYSQGVQSEDAINYSFRSNFNTSTGSGTNYAFYAGLPPHTLRAAFSLTLQTEQMPLIIMKRERGRLFYLNKMELGRLLMLFSQEVIRE